MEIKGTRIAKIFLERNNELETVILPDFKAYCVAIIIKTELYWQCYRHTDHGNREPRKSPIQVQPTEFWQRCRSTSLEEG